MINQDKLDYQTEINKAARDGQLPEHDCHLSSEDGCQVCEDYWDARDFWKKEQSEINNQKLL